MLDLDHVWRAGDVALQSSVSDISNVTNLNMQSPLSAKLLFLCIFLENELYVVTFPLYLYPCIPHTPCLCTVAFSLPTYPLQKAGRVVCLQCNIRHVFCERDLTTDLHAWFGKKKSRTKGGRDAHTLL